MGRWQIISVGLLIGMAAIACTSFPFGSSGSSSSQNGATRIAESRLNIGAVDAEFDGRIASIGVDRNIYVYESGTITVPVTNDAELTDRALEFIAYDHPTWSPDGWLSYVQLDRLADEPVTTVFAERPGDTDPITVVSDDMSRFNYIYGYWSPAVCDEGEDCGQFAYLANDRNGIDLHIARLNSGADDPEDRVISDGNGSLYYSWAPSGEAMLWNRNSTELAIYDVENDTQQQSFDIIPGPFQAPGWSASNRFLFARVDREAEQIALTVSDDTGEVDITSFVNGTFFNWSPDGEKVAFATGVDLPLNPVRIIDQDGGDEIQINEVPFVIAFFWSPDSSKLAIVGVEETPDSEQTVSTLPQQLPVRLVWFVVDAETGDVARLTTFFATAEQSYLLSFFDQYAQSHRVWSPDSRHIVYADAGPELNAPKVFLLNTETPGEAPVVLNDGVLGIFSFE